MLQRGVMPDALGVLATQVQPLIALAQVCLTGANKANAARLALEVPLPRGGFPAQLVRPDAAPALWLLDEAAAAQLELVKAGQELQDGSILFTF